MKACKDKASPFIQNNAMNLIARTMRLNRETSRSKSLKLGRNASLSTPLTKRMARLNTTSSGPQVIIFSLDDDDSLSF